jgi:hypothetical protein
MSHRDPELEQLALNTRRTPQHVLNAHPPNQDPQIRTNWRSTSQIARLPVPVATETSTMPAHDRFRSDNHDGLEDRWKPSIQQDKEQAIAVGELDATMDLASQCDQLMPEGGILRLQSTRRPKRTEQ